MVDDRRAVHEVKIIINEIFGEENFVNEVIWSYKSGGAGKKSFARKHDNLLFYRKSKDFKFFLPKEKSYNRGCKRYASPAKARLGFAITAEGWTAESTPVFVRVTGTSTSGAPVNFYHAVEQENEATRFIELEAGSYTFSYGGPVNADGTMYRADDTVLDIAGDRSIDVFFERIDPAAEIGRAHV